MHEIREKGTAILGIFHDSNVKKELMTRSISMQEFQPKS
jgi:alpha-D-ribose 1-methylphosphonate 5-triphosphate synthase subunit PhnL